MSKVDAAQAAAEALREHAADLAARPMPAAADEAVSADSSSARSALAGVGGPSSSSAPTSRSKAAHPFAGVERTRAVLGALQAAAVAT